MDAIFTSTRTEFSGSENPGDTFYKIYNKANRSYVILKLKTYLN